MMLCLIEACLSIRHFDKLKGKDTFRIDYIPVFDTAYKTIETNGTPPHFSGG